MTLDVLNQLAALIKQEHQAVLSRWRQQVRLLPSARRLDVPTLNDHMPGLIDELAAALQSKLERRVLQNLIANAIKYTPGGAVMIGARELEAEGAIECWVRDNGAGIAEESFDKVFDKGETDPDNEGGTGLGLAIVKTFIVAHGGTVTVESKEGVGSTFRFSMPTKAKASGSSGL